MQPHSHSPRPFAILVTVFAVVIVLLAGAQPAHAVTRTVTNCSDSGAGSLREALADAVDGDTINFTGLGCSTITLTSANLDVVDSITIEGPGRSALSISGGNARRVFVVTAGNDVVISGLTITGGLSSNGSGGGIYAMGALSIVDCALTSNLASGTGDSSGGAITASAGLVVSGTTFTNNSAIGAAGHSGFAGAINANTAGTVSISDSTFTSNVARGTATRNALGGAIATERPMTITNTTFTNNTAEAGATSGDAFGGAIKTYVALTISGTTTFTSNDAIAHGGYAMGGAIHTSGGQVTIGGTTTFVEDQSTVSTSGSAGVSGSGGDGGSAYGGGLYIATGASLVMSGSTTLQREVAVGGAAVASTNGNGGGALGGAIYLDTGTTAAVTGTSFFDDNSATGGGATTASASGMTGSGRGGAIFALGRLDVGTGARFQQNVATANIGLPPLVSVSGGAIAMSGGGTLTGATFRSNSAQDGSCSGSCANSALGGAVYIAGAAVDSLVEIANTTFSVNSAQAGTPANDTQGARGGAVYLSSYGRAKLTNSTVTGGFASYGAGIFINDSPNAFSILNSTIAGNTAGVASGGSGLYYRAGLVVGTIANTILADNNAVGKDCVISASNKLDSNASNLIEDSNAACSTGATGLVTGDAALGALASNGGATQTMALGAGSPALLAADSSICQAAPVSALDQRGVARPVGMCDIGAYQLSAAPPSGGGGSGGSSSTSSDSAPSAAMPASSSSGDSVESAPGSSPVAAADLARRYRVIVFESNSADLDAAARKRVRALMKSSEGRVKITGYAPRGSGRLLAGQRAGAVSRFVRDVEPSAGIDSGAGAARNRRCREVQQNCAVIRIEVRSSSQG